MSYQNIFSNKKQNAPSKKHSCHSFRPRKPFFSFSFSFPTEDCFGRQGRVGRILGASDDCLGFVQVCDPLIPQILFQLFSFHFFISPIKCKDGKAILRAWSSHHTLCQGLILKTSPTSKSSITRELPRPLLIFFRENYVKDNMRQ